MCIITLSYPCPSALSLPHQIPNQIPDLLNRLAHTKKIVPCDTVHSTTGRPADCAGDIQIRHWHDTAAEACEWCSETARRELGRIQLQRALWEEHIVERGENGSLEKRKAEAGEVEIADGNGGGEEGIGGGVKKKVKLSGGAEGEMANATLCEVRADGAGDVAPGSRIVKKVAHEESKSEKGRAFVDFMEPALISKLIDRAKKLVGAKEGAGRARKKVKLDVGSGELGGLETDGLATTMNGEHSRGEEDGGVTMMNKDEVHGDRGLEVGSEIGSGLGPSLEVSDSVLATGHPKQTLVDMTGVELMSEKHKEMLVDIAKKVVGSEEEVQDAWVRPDSFTEEFPVPPAAMEVDGDVEVAGVGQRGTKEVGSEPNEDQVLEHPASKSMSQLLQKPYNDSAHKPGAVASKAPNDGETSQDPTVNPNVGPAVYEVSTSQGSTANPVVETVVEDVNMSRDSTASLAVRTDDERSPIRGSAKRSEPLVQMDLKKAPSWKHAKLSSGFDTAIQTLKRINEERVDTCHQVQVFSEENAKLSKRNARYQAENSELRAANKDLNEQNGNLRMERFALEAKAADMQITNKMLTNQNADLTTEYVNHEMEKVELRAAIKDLGAQNSKLQQEKLALKAKVSNAQPVSKDLGPQNTDLKQERLGLEGKVARLETKAANVQTTNNVLVNQNANLTTEFTKVSEENRTLNVRFREMQNEIADLTQRIEIMHKAEEGRKRNIDGLRKQVAGSERQVMALKEKVSVMKTKMAALEGEGAELRIDDDKPIAISSAVSGMVKGDE